jgi:hypothetical protein
MLTPLHMSFPWYPRKIVRFSLALSPSRPKISMVQPLPATLVAHDQCGQIGRFFTHWVTFFLLNSFLDTYFKCCPHFLGQSYPQLRARTSFGQKIGLGYILGEFFANSSGHPAQDSLGLFDVGAT